MKPIRFLSHTDHGGPWPPWGSNRFTLRPLGLVANASLGSR
jgi:hypothetical protein